MSHRISHLLVLALLVVGICILRARSEAVEAQEVPAPAADHIALQSDPVPCTPNPCLNGGTCVGDTAGNMVSCTCSANYTGNLCNTRRWSADGYPCGVFVAGAWFDLSSVARPPADPYHSENYVYNVCQYAKCFATQTVTLPAFQKDLVNEKTVWRPLGDIESASNPTPWVISLTNPAAGWQGGLTVQYSYGDATYCPGGAHRSMALKIVCAPGVTTLAADGTTAGEGNPCQYYANFNHQAACHPDCPKDAQGLVCHGQGTCSGTPPTCTCSAQYTGPSCSEHSSCGLNPCLNGGTCSATADGLISCACPAKYNGERCENNPCLSSTPKCQNGGTCVSEVATSYTCSCPTGLSGKACETVVWNPAGGVCSINGDLGQFDLTPLKRPVESPYTMPKDTNGNAYTFNICAGAKRGDHTVDDDIRPAWQLTGNPATWVALSGMTLTDPKPWTISYVGSTADPSNWSKGIKIEYSHGNQAWGGCPKERSFTIIVLCTGSKTILNQTAVTEPSVCSYQSTFYHQAACQQACPKNPANDLVCNGQGTCSGWPAVCTCGQLWQGTSCSERRLCQPGICQHGGTCSTTPDNLIHCDCMTGWFGPLCDTPNPCFSSPCQNGGSCTLTDSVYPHLAYTCDCPEKYDGAQCQNNPCLTVPPGCLNGGTCHSQLATAFTCDCDAKFSGPKCESIRWVGGGQAKCQIEGALGTFSLWPLRRPVESPYTMPKDAYGNAYTFNICDAAKRGDRTVDDDLRPAWQLTGNPGAWVSLGGITATDPTPWTISYAGSTWDAGIKIEYAHGNKEWGGGCPKERSFTIIVYCAGSATIVNQTAVVEPSTCSYQSTFKHQAACHPLCPRTAAGVCNLHGTCSGADYKCACDGLFTGPSCSDVVTCEKHPCLHGGTCTPTPGGPSPFTCACDGWFGAVCDQPSPCSSTPCLNGGTCSATAADAFTCACTAAFKGETCDQHRWSPAGQSCSITSPLGTFDLWSLHKAPTNPYFMPTDEYNHAYVFNVCDWAQRPGAGTDTDMLPAWQQSGGNEWLALGGVTDEDFVPWTITMAGKNWDDGVTLKYNNGAGKYCPSAKRRSFSMTVKCANTDKILNQTTVIETALQSCAYATTFFHQSACHQDCPKVNGHLCNDHGTCAGTPPACVCDGFFKGTYCTEKRTCGDSPCLNGGVCNDLGTTFSCSCRPAYAGETCQYPNACASGPCLNGGTCTPDGVEVKCACVSGFLGPTCAQQQWVPNGPSTLSSAAQGFYNLSSLTTPEGYRSQEGSDPRFKYVFNFFAPAPSPKPSTVVAPVWKWDLLDWLPIGAFTADDLRPWTLDFINANSWSSGLRLQYLHGASCGGLTRTFNIQLMCAASLTPLLGTVTESADPHCIYTINVYTQLACHAACPKENGLVCNGHGTCSGTPPKCKCDHLYTSSPACKADSAPSSTAPVGPSHSSSSSSGPFNNSTRPQPQENSDSSLSGGAIAGIVIGSVVVVIAFTAFLWMCLLSGSGTTSGGRKKKKNSYLSRSGNSVSKPLGTRTPSLGPGTSPAVEMNTQGSTTPHMNSPTPHSNNPVGASAYAAPAII